MDRKADGDVTPRPTDALLVIDLQNDFCPGGALAVTAGDSIVPTVNALAARFAHVVLTQDWHPCQHISFASAHRERRPYEILQTASGLQSLWPDHCLQGSHGAAFHPDLYVPHAELILRKGYRREIDSYSAFVENDRTTPTGLAGYLRERGLRRLFLCGLAYDVCVRYSALDGKALGFEAIVLEDATRPVGLHSAVAETGAAFAAAGVQRLLSAEILA